ncbi:MAG: penicillin-binding protein activator LpoB [Spirochaetaceae bacterium]|jgi:TolB-like protein|nr:penicillin-binding protein activator LpoB [Spirochaetaceae bacterium]
MKKLLMVFLCILFCAGTELAAQGKEKLAILPFTGELTETERDAIAEIFSYSKDLANVFALIPRTGISQAIRNERNFQMSSGMTNPDTIAALGKELGAQYVVSGTVSKLGEQNLLIISIIKIDDLRQITGDIQTYTRIEEIQDTLPEMAQTIVNSTRNIPVNLPKLAILPVEIPANVEKSAADTLAQILSIDIIRSGKYAVYPRTSSLEQVTAEYKEQQSKNIDSQSRVDIGQGDNPRLVLQVAARSLGSNTMFNASIIDVETNIQEAGDSVNYESLSDGINSMKELTVKLTGISEDFDIQKQQALAQQDASERQQQRQIEEAELSAQQDSIMNKRFFIAPIIGGSSGFWEYNPDLAPSNFMIGGQFQFQFTKYLALEWDLAVGYGESTTSVHTSDGYNEKWQMETSGSFAIMSPIMLNATFLLGSFYISAGAGFGVFWNMGDLMAGGVFNATGMLALGLGTQVTIGYQLGPGILFAQFIVNTGFDSPEIGGGTMFIGQLGYKFGFGDRE